MWDAGYNAQEIHKEFGEKKIYRTWRWHRISLTECSWDLWIRHAHGEMVAYEHPSTWFMANLYKSLKLSTKSFIYESTEGLKALILKKRIITSFNLVTGHRVWSKKKIDSSCRPSGSYGSSTYSWFPIFGVRGYYRTLPSKRIPFSTPRLSSRSQMYCHENKPLLYNAMSSNTVCLTGIFLSTLVFCFPNPKQIFPAFRSAHS